jgi:hypothetical protein
MLYGLCTSESAVKIGDLILDETPTVGCEVRFAEATWRITGIVWIVEGVLNNRQSSGLVCVERVDDGNRKS